MLKDTKMKVKQRTCALTEAVDAWGFDFLVSGAEGTHLLGNSLEGDLKFNLNSMI
jgi:hypothetical protein